MGATRDLPFGISGKFDAITEERTALGRSIAPTGIMIEMSLKTGVPNVPRSGALAFFRV